MDDPVNLAVTKVKVLLESEPGPSFDAQFKRIVYDFLDQSQTSIYRDVLKLVKALDTRQIKKGTVTKSPAFQVLLGFQNFLKDDTTCLSKEERGWNQELVLAALDHGVSAKNQSWLEKIVDLYHLKDLPKPKLISVIKNLAAGYDFLNAAWIVNKLGYQEDFDIEEIALPLLAQNRVNVMEAYMRGSKKIAEQIIRFLDTCNRTTDPLYSVIDKVPDVKKELLNVRTINKLVKRLAKAFEVDHTVCPNACYWTNLGALKFLIRSRFDEKKISHDAWDELVVKAVNNDVRLQEELVIILASYAESGEAKKWALHFDIPREKWPFALTTEPISRPTNDDWNLDWGESQPKPKPKKPEPQFPELKLRLDEEDIILIETETTFSRAIKEITYNYDLIGYDSEWKPTLGMYSKECEKVALIQIATWDSVYLIDTLCFKESSIWERFVVDIIGNKDLMKIGFGLDHDFKSLQSFIPSLPIKPANILDIGLFSKWIGSHLDIRPVKVPDGVKGLAKLCCTVLGKKLNKAEQFSNWENRPLRKEQINYAAMDAYSLLLIYEKLYKKCEENSLDFHHFFKLFREGKTKIIETQPDSKDEFEDIKFEPTPIKAFKCIVDTMLQGLGRNLRLLGADCEILISGTPHHHASYKARHEQRVILSSGQPYENLKGSVRPGYCYRIQNSLDVYQQMKTVIRRFNLIVTESDLFSRCVKCNCGHFKQLDQKTMKEWCKSQRPLRPGVTINYSNLPLDSLHAETYYLCNQCGQVYWKGYHHKRLKTDVKSILVAEEQLQEFVQQATSNQSNR